jgi:hypothetical protein
MGKLRALAVVGGLLAGAAALTPVAPAAAADACTPAGAPIGGVAVNHGLANVIHVSANSGSWSCTGGVASVSLTVAPQNPLVALLVDRAVGSAAGIGSVSVNYSIAPTLFTVLLLPPGSCFTATETVTGPNGFLRVFSATGCG